MVPLFLFSIQKRIAMESSPYVRMCMALNLAPLSTVAIRFLNQSTDHNYDEELTLLHEYFGNLVSVLLTDSENSVRRALLNTPESCANLCEFFGAQKTNEVIFSHIITFLNDKVSALGQN